MALHAMPVGLLYSRLVPLILLLVEGITRIYWISLFLCCIYMVLIDILVFLSLRRWHTCWCHWSKMGHIFHCEENSRSGRRLYYCLTWFGYCLPFLSLPWQHPLKSWSGIYFLAYVLYLLLLKSFSNQNGVAMEHNSSSDLTKCFYLCC